MNNVNAVASPMALLAAVISRSIPALAQGLAEAAINDVRQAAVELQNAASGIKARNLGSSPTGGGTGSSVDAVSSAGAGAAAQQPPPNMESHVGGGFALPARAPSVRRLVQCIALLLNNVQVLVRVGIVIDVLGDCVWTLLGHIAALSHAAVTGETPPVSANGIAQSGGGGSVSAIGGTGSAASPLTATTRMMGFASTRRNSFLAAVRPQFLAQAPLASLLAALWAALAQRHGRVFSADVRAKELLEWCTRLTSPRVQQALAADTGAGAGAATAAPPEATLRMLHTDVVVALWGLLQSGSTTLEHRTQANPSPSLLADAINFHTGAASYFLSAGTRAFATTTDDAAAVSWCTIAIFFVGVVHEHFTNSKEVQRHLIFDFLPEVMKRFSCEQASTVGALLFHKFFGTPSNNKVAQIVGANADVVQHAVDRLNRDDVNFTSEPLHCLVACIVAVASTPEFTSHTDGGTPALALAFRQCVTDGLVRSTPEQTAPAAMAQLVLLCMLQRLDARRQAAAVRRALPPWDHRFQILSPARLELDQDSELHSFIVDWVCRAVLQHPANRLYHFPNVVRPAARNEMQRAVITAFVDAADLVAAQAPSGAALVASSLVKHLTTDYSTAAMNTTGNSMMMSMMGFPFFESNKKSASATGAAAAAAAAVPERNDRFVLDFGSYQRFLAVRNSTVISIVEKVRRSLFSAIDAAEPWGKLVPRRLYSETALTFYDTIAIAFSSLASDALGIKNNNAFIQSMLQVTRRLIPLAQPFCLAALESPTTVNALIDRFERSMQEVELGARQRAEQQQHQQQQQPQQLPPPAAAETSSSSSSSSPATAAAAAAAAASPPASPKGSLTYKYLVASFTLSGMTDQQGMRVMPNDVFANRWVPLLARACAAIEADSATRNLLEVHCRNCCSALLRSRRTVCPPLIAGQKEPSVGTASLYSGPMTTTAFIHAVETFLSWVVRPVLQPAKSAISRRLAGATFASTFAACVMSVERLETETDMMVGSDIAVRVLAQTGGTLLAQISYNTAQVRDRYEREVFADGNARFAEGIASCVACIDDKARATVQHYVDLIMSSPASVFPRESKKKVIEMMSRSVGFSKFLRGEVREQVAKWIARNEPKWMLQGGHGQGAVARPSILRFPTLSKL